MCKNCGCHGLQIEQDSIKLERLDSEYSKTVIASAVRALPGVLAAEIAPGTAILSFAYDPAKSKHSDICAAINTAVFHSTTEPGKCDQG